MSEIIQELIDSKRNPTIKTVCQPTIKTIYQEPIGGVTYRNIEIIDQNGTHPNRPGSMYRLCDVVTDLFNALLTLGLRFPIIGMIIEDVLEWGELLGKQNKHLVSMSIFVDRLKTALQSRGLQQRDLFGVLTQVFK